MNLSDLQGEEKLLLSRLEDLAEIASSRYIPRFTHFLNERQVLIAAEFIRQRGIEDHLIDGGYPDAVRRVVGFFPPGGPPDAADFPFTAVDIRFRREDRPGHRDFLGSLMGLQITRESVGDILIQPGLCTVFLLDPVVPAVVDGLSKVGRVGVRCERAAPREFVSTQSFVEQRGTVSSPRMDCLVSLITGKSREKSAALIRGELVEQDHVTVTSVAKNFAEGECITIRGYGKYLIDGIGSPTRKGRLPVCFRKYS